MILSFLAKKIIKVLVSISLVGMAVYILDLDAIATYFKNVSVTSIIVAISINILTFFVMGWRWYILSRESLILPFKNHIAYYYKATFLNTFTPANLGGDVFRIAALSKYSVSKSRLLKLIIRERIVGLYGILIVFMVAYGFVVNSLLFNVPAIVNPYNYGVLLAISFFLLSPFLHIVRASLVHVFRNRMREDFYSKFTVYADVLGELFSIKGSLFILMLSFLAVILWVTSIAVVVQGFGFSIPFIHIAVVATLVELVRLVPVTVQGIGLREGAFSYLLTFLGHSPEQGYIVAIAAYLTLSVSIILAGPIGNALSDKD